MLRVHDYQCTDCDHVFEKFVKATDTLPKCPVCLSTKTTKIATRAAFKVTGQGQHSSKMKV